MMVRCLECSRVIRFLNFSVCSVTSVVNRYFLNDETTFDF